MNQLEIELLGRWKYLEDERDIGCDNGCIDE